MSLPLSISVDEQIITSNPSLIIILIQSLMSYPPSIPRKPNRSQYGIEEELLDLLFRLNDKKSSQLFRQPVSVAQAPDYYLKIKYPMDLTTIQTKLKEGQYLYAAELLQDLNYIITNCYDYNRLNEVIKKSADKFSICISTEYQNFLKECDQKGLNIGMPLSMQEDTLERLLAMEERRQIKRRATTMSLLDSQEKSKFGTGDYEFFNYINSESMKGYTEDRKVEEQFEGFEVNVEDFGTMTEQQRKQRLLIVLDGEEINEEFKTMSRKKLDKYRGILNTKITWFRDKILKKTMSSKKFGGLTVPAHLDKNMDTDDIAKTLNIRKLQLFVKQMAYFIQAFQHILTDSMKEKFILNCRAIRSCLAQVIKYKRIQPKSTKIKLENPFIEVKLEHDKEMPQEIEINAEETKSTISEETKGYEQKMKEFRRLLERDKKEHTGKDTKVRLNKEKSGAITSSIVYEEDDKKKSTRYGKKPIKDSYKFDVPKDDEEKRREEELNEERNRDRGFISEYNKRSNVEIIRKYGKRVAIDWERGVEKNLPKETIEFWISK